MDNTEPRPSDDEPRLKGMKSFRCTFGPATPTDFVWPPPPAEVEVRGIVPTRQELDGFVSPAPAAILETPAAILETSAAILENDSADELENDSAADQTADELVWPPPAGDLEACSVVLLSEEEDADGDPVEVTIEDFRVHTHAGAMYEDVPSQEDVPTVELPIPAAVLARLNREPAPVAPPAVVDVPPTPAEPPPLIPFASDEADPEDPLEEEEEPPAFDFPPPSHESPAEAAKLRGSGLAWAAVFTAISCLAVAYSEYRAGRREATQAVYASEVPPPEPETPSAPPPAPPMQVDRAPEPAAQTPAQASRPDPAPSNDAKAAKPARAVEPPRRREPAPEPEPRVVLRAASATPSRQPQAAPAPTKVSAPPPVPVRAVVASSPARDTAPAATSTIALATPPAPVAEPAVHPAVLDTGVENAGDAADQEHIATTLTRWRTAYSKLDARAAREVWPSVDVTALDRAFRGLKSQDLRFDRCDLTVDGLRARASCRGSAVYVPRVGNQSPKATPREWTFELLKADQRWTIASARSS